jgi:hypothetical protein
MKSARVLESGPQRGSQADGRETFWKLSTAVRQTGSTMYAFLLGSTRCITSGTVFAPR